MRGKSRRSAGTSEEGWKFPDTLQAETRDRSTNGDPAMPAHAVKFLISPVTGQTLRT